MQYVSKEEKSKLELKLQDLYRRQIDAQERITRAAALGDLSENAEYQYAKDENRDLQKEIAGFKNKLASLAVVDDKDLPEDMVFLGHTVKLQDMDDDSEQLVKLVGEVETPDSDSEILPVSSTSPLGDALMKARVGDVVKVHAPRGSMEFKILEIL